MVCSTASAFESVSVGGRLPGRLALTSPAPSVGARDRLDFSSVFSPFFFFLTALSRERVESQRLSLLSPARNRTS